MNVVADRLSLALDPARFTQRAGIDPDPWQRELLRSTAQQTILNCSRQSGKSTITAVIAAHTAEYHPPALILLLSPSLRQSSELFRKLLATRHVLGDEVCPVAEESALRLELVNGSRIVCLPGKDATVRGFSGTRLLVIDEASRVDDSLYQAVRPMLAVSGGRLILLSTPFGMRGFFHDAWENGGPSWQRVSVTADQCPRIPEAWLAAERALIGDFWFRQEYLCEFVQTLDQVFSYEETMAAVNPDLEPLFGGWRASDDRTE